MIWGGTIRGFRRIDDCDELQGCILEDLSACFSDDEIEQIQLHESSK